MTVRLTPNHTILLETKHQLKGTRGGDCRFEIELYMYLYMISFMQIDNNYDMQYSLYS